MKNKTLKALQHYNLTVNSINNIYLNEIYNDLEAISEQSLIGVDTLKQRYLLQQNIQN